MKRYILHITTFVACLLVSSSVWGQGTSGTWNATTLNANTTINLTGNITVKGKITIPNGKTLTINPNGRARTIKAEANINQIFYIENGGTLVINGTETNPITIDGGATFPSNKTFTVSGSTYTPTTSGGYKLDEAIANMNGTMTLSYVTIQNVNGDKAGGGIYIGGVNNGEERISTLTNCTIKTCVSEQGSAIQITNSNDKETKKGDAENSRLVVKNSTISDCYSWGDGNGGSGGTIRTNGNCVANLYFINTTVKDNYTAGAGCGIYWNGKGTDKTKCVFDGCTFQNNVAKGQGGGMMLETDFEFINTETGKSTTIKENKVTNENGTGGGIVVTSYGGGAMAIAANNQYTFTYDLSDKVTIEGNTAGQGAGISFNLAGFALNSDWINNDNSSRKVIINLNLVGATIKDNKASTGNGGGIRFFNNTANAESNHIGNRSLEINVKLDKGTISGNTAVGNGAGIYLYNANISNNAGDSDLLYVNSNKAEGMGGGIYVDGGKTITLKNNSMTSNVATNGAAIYLSGGSGVNVTLGKTTMTSNISSGDGGALFVNGGNLTISGDESTFSSNSSSSGNGGFAYVSGTININGSSTATGNKAVSGNGGCAYIASGNLNIATGKTLNIQNNSSKNGGAVYLNAGNIDVKGAINAGNIKANTATENGGAIYLNTGNLTLNEGTFSNNTAKNGGGIYMGGGIFTLNGTATLNSNSATSGNGGAIYLGSGTFTVANAGKINVGSIGAGNKAITGNGGGIYCAGTFTVDGKAAVSYNQAINGGGICVQNGGVTLPAGKESTINNNQATKFGGGLYVLNTDNSKTPSVSFNGGTFTGNTAESGGAVCASGNMTLSLGSTMENNTATNGNGGAIYMIDGVKMTFKDGLIRANKALGTLVSDGTATANKNTYVTGVGGGIFMANSSTLEFSNPDLMGIYNNSATNAGADICVNGNGTSITLPPMGSMKLQGFDVPGNELYWVQDYFKEEPSSNTGYAKGIRYEDALKIVNHQFDNYKINNGIYTDKYLCLDLGYDLVFVQFTTTGLQEHDDAAITMSYPKAILDNSDKVTSYENVLYRKVLFIGPQTKTVGLPSGDWKFEATNWSYQYNNPTFAPGHITVKDKTTDKYINIKRGLINESSGSKIIIKFTPKENVGEPEVDTGGGETHKKYVKQAKSRVVNRMGNLNNGN